MNGAAQRAYIYLWTCDEVECVLTITPQSKFDKTQKKCTSHLNVGGLVVH